MSLCQNFSVNLGFLSRSALCTIRTFGGISARETLYNLTALHCQHEKRRKQVPCPLKSETDKSCSQRGGIFAVCVFSDQRLCSVLYMQMKNTLCKMEKLTCVMLLFFPQRLKFDNFTK